MAGVVSLQTPEGAVLGQAVTDSSGRFQLDAPAGLVHLVVDSGQPDRRSLSLPASFRWTADFDLSENRTLSLVLPATHRIAVVATDTGGQPVHGAVVTGTEAAPVTAAGLWTGGPVLSGTQRLTDGPVLTDVAGRAHLWSFPTSALASTNVEHFPEPGVELRTSFSGNVVERETMIVAIPARPSCVPRQATDLGRGKTSLVADLDQVAVRQHASRSALISAADKIVSGSIPEVTYNAARTGDALRYLYDESVALRRQAGILAYAYAATKRTTYLQAMARKVALNPARWPDWNPGHPLDNAQMATAVSLAYAWAGSHLTSAERAEVSSALVTRMLLPYSCADGALSAKRMTRGNQNSVFATASAVSGLAVRNDAATAWGSVGVGDGAGAVARFQLADGTGFSLADGPTVEGQMYTNYEASNVALLHATRWRNLGDPAITAALTGALPDFGVLAEWNERCGTVVDPDAEDAHELYPWVDRTTALAAMTAWPGAGARVQELLDGLQSRDTLYVPEHGSWTVPDGIAELIVSTLQPGTSRPPEVQAYAPPSSGAGAFWGCATNGAMRALVSGAPNNAPHAHRDAGNVLVSHGDQDVLADLGQRDYSLTGVKYVWRGLTKAHNTVGVLQADGRVTQTDRGWGTISTTADAGLEMVSGDAMNDIDWRRRVAITSSSVTVRDQLSLQPGVDPAAAQKTMSLSFLLPTPVSRVSTPSAGVLHFGLADGSAWELRPPTGTTMTVASAQPTPPYDDTEAFKVTLGPAHALVVLTAPLGQSLELTTTVTRVSP